MNNTKDSVNKSQNSLNKLISYFVIIAFLFPRGYAEYNLTYKNIFTAFVWLATAVIWVQFFFMFFKPSIKKEAIPIVTYFVGVIIITIIIRGSSITGYQKLITYPSICLFVICNLKNNPKSFLNIVNNVSLVLLVLQQIVLRSFFSQQYHITFLGHVQMIAQLGTLMIFSALIYWMMFHEKRKKTILIVLLSLFTMLTTDASSAVLTCVILFICAMLYKLKLYRFLTCNSKFYIFAGIILNIAVIALSVTNNLKHGNAEQVLDFSGRSFVWIDALSKIQGAVLFGYGIEGVLLTVFWNKWVSEAAGFNYAHNQLLQNLLDGGLVISIIFILMLFAFCKNVKNISNPKYKMLINSMLIIFSIIMIFESPTLYCYMFMCFAMIYALPDAIEKAEKKQEVDEPVLEGVNVNGIN